MLNEEMQEAMLEAQRMTRVFAQNRNYLIPMRKVSWRVKTGRLYSPNGNREVTRRQHQIEAGQLKVV